MTQEELKKLYELLLKAEQALPGNKYYEVRLHTEGYKLAGVDSDGFVDILNPNGTIDRC